MFFTGVFQGLWRTTPAPASDRRRRERDPPERPPAEGYNHIGDPTWNPGDGGRVILPMECYDASAGNTCGTRRLRGRRPVTLACRYYVKLDPGRDPQGDVGGDLAEREADLDQQRRRPARLPLRRGDPSPTTGRRGPLLHPVRRLEGAVPPSGVTGAVFRGRRLLLAGADGGSVQVWCVNPRTGKRRLEIEMQICGESEGLGLIRTLGGELHWLIGRSTRDASSPSAPQSHSFTSPRGPPTSGSP